jgi:hypothetical protein
MSSVAVAITSIDSRYGYEGEDDDEEVEVDLAIVDNTGCA